MINEAFSFLEETQAPQPPQEIFTPPPEQPIIKKANLRCLGKK